MSKPSYPLLENTGKNLLKLYLNDVGLLTGAIYRNNILPIINDEASVNLGSVYESVVAQELRAHDFTLNYYDNKKNGEVDYIVDDADNLTVMPIEVKSGKDYKRHIAIDRLIATPEYGIKKALVLSNERQVFTQDGITYLPIYHVMFLQPSAIDSADFIAI